MNNISRRSLLTLSTAGVFLPGDVFAAGVPKSKFVGGRLRGFVIGTVRNGSESYFDQLAATGAKFGRIFISFIKCTNCDKFKLPDGHAQKLKDAIKYAAARGVNLVVVAEFPDVGSNIFWGNSSLKSSFLDSWLSLSRIIANDPIVVGLDLMNEPNPPWPSNNIVDTHQVWTTLAQKAIDVLRADGVTTTIIYEGVAGGSNLGLKGLTPLNDDNIVYSIHYYTPHEITHQFVTPDRNRAIPYPAGIEWGLGKWDPEIGVTAWDKTRMEVDLRHTIAFQAKYGVPIYVGEFSCVRWAPSQSRQRYVEDCLSIFKKYGWSWTFHEFRGWPGWDAEIDSEDMNYKVRTANAPVMNLLRSQF